LLQRTVKALGYSATEEVRGQERHLVARLLRHKTKVSVGWLTKQFGLQTRGGMRYGLHRVGQQLASDKTLQRTWRTTQLIMLTKNELTPFVRSLVNL
jgi:hypothetical protein